MDLQTFRERRAAGTLKVRPAFFNVDKRIDFIHTLFGHARQHHKDNNILYVNFNVNFGAKDMTAWFKWITETHYDAYVLCSDRKIEKIETDTILGKTWSIYFFPMGTTTEEVEIWFPDYKLVTN